LETNEIRICANLKISLDEAKNKVQGKGVGTATRLGGKEARDERSNEIGASASGNLLRRAIHAPAQGSRSRYLDASCSSRNSTYITPRLNFQYELFTSVAQTSKSAVLRVSKPAYC
jgi:hypothetical protein